jgi:hypothetical protein
MLDAGIIMVSNRRPWMKIFYNPLTKRMDISKLGAIVLSISLLGGISLIPALQVRVYGQQQEERIIGLKITSHEQGQEVPIGEITISGTSTDNATSDCAVYADVNDIKPFQKAVATGPGGENDYSTWNFTYTDNYHLITNGTNELTSKLSCVSGPANLTKWNSVIVVGVMNKNGQQQEQPVPTSIVNDTTTSDSSNALKNSTAPSAENNAAAPFVFPLPSENSLPSTS